MLTRCIASLQIGVGDEEHSESAGVILVGGAVSEGFGIWDLVLILAPGPAGMFF